MKTIVLYATKYGAAEEIAKHVAEKIDGAPIYNLKQETPSLPDYDCVIIGSSLYAGSIRKEAKAFLLKNENLLQEKKLGFFLCGIGAEGEKQYFNANFPANLLQKAKSASFLGGVFDPKKANGIERFIIKMITKKSVYFNTINDEKIDQFAETMKA